MGCAGGFGVLYIYYIYPELRIGNFRFRSGKGAGPLWREQRGSKGEQRGSTEGARGSTMGQSRGAAHWSLNWLPCTRL